MSVRTSHRRPSAALGLALLWLGGCREAPSPYQPPERGAPAGPVWPLTFSVQDDRAPAWSPAGDSVYYTAEWFEHLSDSQGVLAGIPRDGREAARPLLSTVQIPSGVRRWLVAPAVAPRGDRIAYVEMWNVWPPGLCRGQRTCSSLDTPPPARLGEAVLRVRRWTEVGPIEGDPALRIRFAGIEVEPYTSPTEFTTRYHPFQRLFSEEGSFIFRPSWAPDGRRLAYSDGLGLWIWTIGDEEPVRVPDTRDGVWPAWSPDGEWIAFTRLERADSSGSYCSYAPPGGSTTCVEERTDYAIGRRVLTLVRPDGSELVELGAGEEPAWAPDGSALYFRRAERIWRMDRDGTGAAPMPGTEHGREPAVSSDGRFLAFARPIGPRNHDVWVVSLEEGSTSSPR